MVSAVVTVVWADDYLLGLELLVVLELVTPRPSILDLGAYFR
jgi:hypothetical protein